MHDALDARDDRRALSCNDARPTSRGRMPRASRRRCPTTTATRSTPSTCSTVGRSGEPVAAQPRRPLDGACGVHRGRHLRCGGSRGRSRREHGAKGAAAAHGARARGTLRDGVGGRARQRPPRDTPRTSQGRCCPRCDRRPARRCSTRTRHPREPSRDLNGAHVARASRRRGTRVAPPDRGAGLLPRARRGARGRRGAPGRAAAPRAQGTRTAW